MSACLPQIVVYPPPYIELQCCTLSTFGPHTLTLAALALILQGSVLAQLTRLSRLRKLSLTDALDSHLVHGDDVKVSSCKGRCLYL